MYARRGTCSHGLDFSLSRTKYYFALSLRLQDLLGTQANIFLFGTSPFVFFTRRRLRLGQYFELLVPRSVSDARLVDPAPTWLKNEFAKLPPMEPTARNVILWNKGRHAINQYATYYLKRVQSFMGVYLACMFGVTVYQILKMVITARSDEGFQMTCVFVQLCWAIFSTSVVVLLMISAGIRTNNQPKLLASALKHFRTRIKATAAQQIEGLERRGDHEAALGLAKSTQELHKALTLVENELDAEAQTEKLNIMGVTVDSEMFRTVMAMWSTTAFAVWNALSGA